MRGALRAARRGGAALALALALAGGQPAEAQDAISFDNSSALDVNPACDGGGGLLPAARAIQPEWMTLWFILLLLHMFWALSYVVERVLLPSIHVGLGRRLWLPDSVSGASLFSLGGCSIPLLVINLFSLSQENATSTGISMVLGSAAFNFFCILPVCVLLSDWEITPVYWWPLVRDFSFYIVGLSLFIVFTLFGTADWRASAAERVANCWGGQEAICCYQGFGLDQQSLNDPISEPVSYGVFVWWEGLVLFLVYLLYLVVLRNHQRLKRIVERGLNWAMASLCCSESYLSREQSKRTRHKQELEEHLEKQQKLGAKPETTGRSKSRSPRSKDPSPAPGTAAAAVAAANGAANKGNILTLLATATQSRSTAVQRASCVLVLRLGGTAALAFGCLDPHETGTVSRAALKRYLTKWRFDVLERTAFNNFHSKEVDGRLRTVAKELLAEMAQRTPGSGGAASVAGSSRLRRRNTSGMASQASTAEDDVTTITAEGFTAWYTWAESQLVRELNAAFDLLDESSCGEVSVDKLGSALELLGCRPSKRVVRKTREKLEINANGCIGRSEFTEWYRACMTWTSAMARKNSIPGRVNGASVGSVPTGKRGVLGAGFASPTLDGTVESVSLDSPTGSRSGYHSDGHAVSIPIGPMIGDRQALPNVWSTTDGRIPPVEIWSPTESSLPGFLGHLLGMPTRTLIYCTTRVWTGPAETLGLSGALLWVISATFWIALFSWVLLFASETVALTLGIPNSALGSSVLAIGVNAPHFLSAVNRTSFISNQSKRAYHIVRSLEQSIKGNLFDLLMGLPLAIVVSSLSKGRPVFVGASNLGSSALVLLLFVVLLMLLWVSSRWDLHPGVCVVMLLLYLLFMLQDLLLADWMRAVPSYIACSGCRSDMVCASVPF